MPNTQARGVPLRGSKVANDVIAAAKVSAVRSATVCGSVLRRAKYAVTAATFARYSASNSDTRPAGPLPCGAGRDRGQFSDVDGIWLTLLVGFLPRQRHTPPAPAARRGSRPTAGPRRKLAP